MTSRTEAEAVMDAFGAAFEEGDIAALQSLYTPDAVVWHNHDEIATPVAHNLVVLGWIMQHTSSRSYQAVRRWFDGDSVVEQHVVVMRSLSGEEICCPACLIVQISGDRISRIDEFIDPAPFARLAAG